MVRAPTTHHPGAAGSFANDDRTACTQCPPGFSCANGVKQACVADGTASEGTGNTFCSVCAAGSFASDDRTACVECGAGSFCVNGIETPCQPGFASAGSRATCDSCRVGTYTDAPGTALPCTLCPAGTRGTRTSANASADCEACQVIVLHPGMLATTL